jgi:hypothetical protein
VRDALDLGRERRRPHGCQTSTGIACPLSRSSGAEKWGEKPIVIAARVCPRRSQPAQRKRDLGQHTDLCLEEPPEFLEIAGTIQLYDIPATRIQRQVAMSDARTIESGEGNQQLRTQSRNFDPHFVVQQLE